MRITFCTPTRLDLPAVAIMGVSVKSSEAIGRFGTGLKYALAWLLRNDHAVVIDGLKVSAREVQVRGKTFQQVYIEDEPCGFTTDLGPDWRGWMAYRELYANTLDEGGGFEPCGGTIIEVTCPVGSAFAEAHMNRDSIIVPQERWTEVSSRVSVIPKPSKVLYVRGVRAGPTPKPAICTWNHQDPWRSMLSEDRLLIGTYSYLQDIATAVVGTSDGDLIRRVVLAPKGALEHDLQFTNPSRTFIDVVAELKGRPDLNPTALSAIREAGSYDPITLTPWLESRLAEAKHLAEKVLPIGPVNVTRDFGGASLGAYDPKTNEVWIAEDAFNRGVEDLAATLIEEELHRSRGFADCSRAMQDYLLNRLVRAIAENADV